VGGERIGEGKIKEIPRVATMLTKTWVPLVGELRGGLPGKRPYLKGVKVCPKNRPRKKVVTHDRGGGEMDLWGKKGLGYSPKTKTCND